MERFLLVDPKKGKNMMRALYTATTGMLGQQLQIDTISNNIANVNTTAYKKQRAEFNDLFYQTLQHAGSATSQNTISPTGIAVGLGVSPGSINKLFSQGSLKETENNLDLAITGRGFFAVNLPNGQTAYTRSGNFKLDNNGTIVTSEGYALNPQLQIPENAVQIAIGNDGTVSAVQNDGTSEIIGQIQLSAFNNPTGLHPLGNNLYIATNASGAPVAGVAGENGFGAVKQGFLELSNVRLVEEMSDLITGQRAYEANSKSIQTADSMLQIVNGLKR